MAIYVYNSTTGALSSWCPDDTDPVASSDVLAANGLVSVSGLPALGPTVGWNAATKTTATVTAPIAPQPILTSMWIMRFTAAEFQAINASTDPTVQQFMYALNHTQQVDLTNAQMIDGANYIASINLIQSARLTAIMAVPASIDGP